ncbi:MAG: hypothetical protein K8S27_04075 [Candidatus Omnitrophica bacterium]|nr:hypothetical protein [Candidatus Omnitrophota bacterium]
MRKNSFIFNFKSLPLAYIFCLFLFIVAENGVHHYRMHILPISDRIIVYKGRMLNKIKPVNFDALLIGDSRLLGVDAKIIGDLIQQEKKKTFRCYNLSIPDSGIPAYYLILKKYLEDHKGQPPKWIFLSTSSSGLMRNHEDRARQDIYHRFALLFPYSEGIKVVPIRDWLKYSIVKLESNSTMISFRKRIRDIFMNRELLDQKIVPICKAAYNRHGGIMQGSQNEPIPDWVFEDTDYFRNTDFEVDAHTEKWLRQFFELTARHGIQVGMFNMPMAQVIVENRNKKGFYQAFQAKVDDWQHKYPHVHFIGPPDIVYENKFFLDQHHLGGYGFQQFQQDFVRVLLDEIPDL